jgi:2-dehydropantoate 2-reductase
MRTLVIGGGGVGSLIAGYMVNAGRDVVVLDGWKEHVQKVRRAGLQIDGVEDSFTVRADYRSIHESSDSGRFDLVVIATKAYATAAMTQTARAHSHRGTILMAAQNGMPDDIIKAVDPAARLLGCVVGLGAQVIGPGRVRRTTAQTEESIHLGLIAESDVSLEELELVRAELEPVGGVSVASDIQAMRWMKLSINACTNGLSALTGLDVAELWSSGRTLDIVIAVTHETVTVAEAAGVRMEPAFGVDHAHWVEAASVSDPRWEAIRSSLRAIAAQRTGSKATKASMLQDVLNGRPTEIRFINGWLAQTAATLGVEAPVNAALLAAVLEVESGARALDVANADGLLALAREVYA